MDAFANQWSFDMLTQSSAVALVRRFASVMSGRSLLAGVALLAACDLVIAQATDWPTRSVTVIVPFAAGGNTDIMARLASQKLADDFKQPFVVENRVGAGGAIAANYVAQAAPDGYTLFFAASPQIAVLPNVQKVNYDPIKDFTPVSVFGTGPFILAISAAIPAKTIPEFVSYAKGRKLNYGSGGTGSVSHLSGALFVARAGLDSVHIPFRGGAPAMSALLGGQVDMYFGNAADIIPHVESGKARIIGVAADKRMKQLPDVPTVSETYPEFFAVSLERLSGAVEDAESHRRQARQAGHRRGEGSGCRRATDQAGHRAERHDARRNGGTDHA